MRLNLAIALLGITLLTIAAPIAAKDPNISPIQFAKVRQSEVTPLDLGDTAEAIFVLRVNEKPVLYTYSDIIYKTGAYRLSHNPEEKAVGIWYPVYTTRLKSAIELYSFLNNLQLPDIEVLTYNEWKDANSNLDLIYNSYRSFVYI